MKRTAKEIGNTGEKLVAEYLRKKGFVISCMNYRSRFGEIDVIAENDEYILFVEVKTRSLNSAKFARAKDNVDYNKRQRIIATAEYYILNNGVILTPRFDVAEVYVGGSMSINYIEDAFGV